MPMADDHQGQGKSWKPNHYILAALGGTLAVAVVVTITSLILSPPQVTFSVTHASRRTIENGDVNLTVTVAAYNPSHRCKVSYRSVFIDLKNSSTAAGKSSINANTDKTFPTDYVPGPNETQITASAVIGNENGGAYFARRLNRTGLTVWVRALVRFKIGVTPTRQYGIRVSCPDVGFLDFNSSTPDRRYNCSG